MHALNTDIQKENIRKAIRDAEMDLRKRLPILQYQDTIGLSIFCGSIIGVIAMSMLYGLGVIPWWLALSLNMIFLSFLHELEHDLIHYIYFKKNQKIQDLMMWGVWIMRANIINPFVRRKIHFHHHKHSGTIDDSEERLLGNGKPYNLKRIILTIEHHWASGLKTKRRV